MEPAAFSAFSTFPEVSKNPSPLPPSPFSIKNRTPHFNFRPSVCSELFETTFFDRLKVDKNFFCRGSLVFSFNSFIFFRGMLHLARGFNMQIIINWIHLNLKFTFNFIQFSMPPLHAVCTRNAKWKHWVFENFSFCIKQFPSVTYSSEVCRFTSDIATSGKMSVWLWLTEMKIWAATLQEVTSLALLSPCFSFQTL